MVHMTSRHHSNGMDKIRYYQPRDQLPEEEDSDNDIDPSELSYSLEIVQQPQRARMCGFGDKDRRNITPAPVLKLVAKTPKGKVVPASRLGRQAFIVNADLWLEDETTERNLVMISTISSTKLPSRLHPSKLSDVVSGSSPLFHSAEGQDTEDPPSLQGRHSRSVAPPTPNTPSQAEGLSVFPGESYRQPSSHQWEGHSRAMNDQQSRSRFEDRNSAVNEEMDESCEGYDEADWDSLSTPNLVGQTTVGGQIAPDLDNKRLCIWFAFSVLSIRTEGVFKLRFSLFDLMQVDGRSTHVICQVFSDSFHVQSPKKFLGTCDNNDIANHLNKYSIRIPSRKDEKTR
ncbi:velvet factor [Mortierella sp. GBAus27b]|nr:velvet factor [Mortierella sp. GBAus27b]